VTTGGALLDSVRRGGGEALTFAWDAEPRSALGWSFASLLGIAGVLGLDGASSDLRGALDEMRALGRTIARDVAEDANPAKQMARRLHGTLPVFVGAQALAPVAYRWRTQVNENAKSWAIADELPEMNHNAQPGYGLASEIVPHLHAVLLRHAAMHPRIRLRVDATAAEMRAHGVAVEVIDVEGTTVLAQMLRAVLLGDYASYYLGLLNGVHPSPVTALGRLKDLLASKPG
jgi:glucose/mannose-6-phosphate isomerase